MSFQKMDFRTFLTSYRASFRSYIRGGKKKATEKRSLFVRLRRLVFGLIVGFFLCSLLVTWLFGFAPIPMTPLMVVRMVEGKIKDKPFVFAKDWVSLADMAPNLQHAVIAAEDIRFFEHNGFDWEAIEKALRHNERSRRVRGGSTISQQVAKNVFLWPQRSWVRKILEAYFTGLIEIFWPKRRIMEVYLNVIELGDGVYGVEAASRKYFGKPARQVNTSEAALMAAVLPNPRRFLISRPSPYIRFRQTMISRRMGMAAQTIPR